MHLIAKVNATLTPQKAHSLVWNRTVNNGGGARKNISLDLRMEHIVHLHKEILSNLGVNLTPEAALRCSKAVIGTLSTKTGEGDGYVCWGLDMTVNTLSNNTPGTAETSKMAFWGDV